MYFALKCYPDFPFDTLKCHSMMDNDAKIAEFFSRLVLDGSTDANIHLPGKFSLEIHKKNEDLIGFFITSSVNRPYLSTI